MRPSETDVHVALRMILADKKSYNTSLNWAVEYIRAGLHMSGHSLSVQCLYVLNNIQKWRHPDAKEVRRVLKEYSKK
jgi:hypothetical protein